MKNFTNLLILLFMPFLSRAQRPERDISADFKFNLQSVSVDGIELKYYEEGSGDPILFLHGIPSSSYLWRNVVPIVSSTGRAIALDLAGYGQSDLPLNRDYSFASQYAYLEKFISKMNLKNVTLVVNDLGSALGIKYAIENEHNVKALVTIEGAFMPARDWHHQLTTMQKIMFSMFRRHPALAERMIVKGNRLPKMVMKMGTSRTLSPGELAFYSKPYKENEQRRKVYLHGPGPASFQKKGITKQPGDFSDILDKNAAGLLTFSKPMLLLYATPGLITRKPALEYARQKFKRCTAVHIGKGKHFLPEDHPRRIGNEINKFLNQLTTIKL
jgi:haloalkane dehalogenase